jgi:hypothetical protein
MPSVKVSPQVPHFEREIEIEESITAGKKIRLKPETLPVLQLHSG